MTCQSVNQRTSVVSATFRQPCPGQDPGVLPGDTLTVSCRRRSLGEDHAVASDVVDGRRPDRAEGLGEVALEDVEDLPHPCLAPGRQPPQVGPSDQHRLGSEGDGLDHVGAASHAAVHQDVGLVADYSGDAWERGDRGDGPVHVVTPWLETEMASAPASTARRASSGSRIPFTMKGRPTARGARRCRPMSAPCRDVSGFPASIKGETRQRTVVARAGRGSGHQRQELRPREWSCEGRGSES